MFDLIFLSLAGVYFFKIIFFRVGCFRADKVGVSTAQPFVSVIIAARDEEQNIGRCLEALSKIEYPSDRLEIIVIDDQSADRTGEITEDWKKRIVTLISMKTNGTMHNLHGKANAVAQAIEQSHGEIILTTDADCVVQPSWVKNIVKRYTPEVGCVCGYTLLETKGIFSGMQSLDWAYLLTIASAGVGWNLPLSAVGNNMSFRRKAFDEVGGYRGIGFSVTEDMALLKAIGYKTKWKIRYPLRKETLVWSSACANIREIYLQKKRWGRGGIRIHPLGYLIMSVGFLMCASVLVMPFLVTHLWSYAIGLAAKWIGDWYLVQRTLAVLGQKRLRRYFIVYEIYYVLYVILLPFILLFTGRVTWKGRKL